MSTELAKSEWWLARGFGTGGVADKVQWRRLGVTTMWAYAPKLKSVSSFLARFCQTVMANFVDEPSTERLLPSWHYLGSCWLVLWSWIDPRTIYAIIFKQSNPDCQSVSAPVCVVRAWGQMYILASIAVIRELIYCITFDPRATTHAQIFRNSEAEGNLI